MTIKEINSLLRVERYETEKGNKGLKVYLKRSHDDKSRPFFMNDKEIDRMYEILHEED